MIDITTRFDDFSFFFFWFYIPRAAKLIYTSGVSYALYHLILVFSSLPVYRPGTYYSTAPTPTPTPTTITT